jgi:hypothetical protein
MTKRLTLLLVLVMIFSLTACKEEITTVQDPAGQWTWAVTIGGDQMGMPDFQGSFTMTVLLNLQDGQFSMGVDEDALRKSATFFAEELVAYMVIQGASREDAQSAVDQMDIVAMFTQSMAPFTSSGTYETKNDKLILISTNGQTATYTYALSGDTMTLNPESEAEQETLKAFGLKAMEMKRK